MSGVALERSLRVPGGWTQYNLDLPASSQTALADLPGWPDGAIEVVDASKISGSSVVQLTTTGSTAGIVVGTQGGTSQARRIPLPLDNDAQVYVGGGDGARVLLLILSSGPSGGAIAYTG